MPRPARPWFRFYVEAIYDEKLLRLRPPERWLWVVILAAARASTEPGRLLIATGMPMTVEELAHKATLRPKDILPALESMKAMGMLGEVDGVLEVLNWNDRQFESDDVTARTSKLRSEEQRRNVPTTPEGTPPETEAETEPERAARKRAVAPPEDFKPDDELRSWAARDFPAVNLEAETAAWLDWCQANGRVYKNVRSGWKTWIRRAKPNGTKVDPPAGSLLLHDRKCRFGECDGNGWTRQTDSKGLPVRCRCVGMKAAS